LHYQSGKLKLIVAWQSIGVQSIHVEIRKPFEYLVILSKQLSEFFFANDTTTAVSQRGPPQGQVTYTPTSTSAVTIIPTPTPNATLSPMPIPTTYPQLEDQANHLVIIKSDSSNNTGVLGLRGSSIILINEGEGDTWAAKTLAVFYPSIDLSQASLHIKLRGLRGGEQAIVQFNDNRTSPGR